MNIAGTSQGRVLPVPTSPRQFFQGTGMVPGHSVGCCLKPDDSMHAVVSRACWAVVGYGAV